MEKYLTTTEAAAKLGVTMRRVQQLISRGELRAQRVGRDWLIAPKDLGRLERRPVGRPSAESS